MGQIITLSDNPYKFELPSLPPEEEIWYYNVKKSEQYWLTPFNSDHRWLDPDGNIKNVKRMTERERGLYIDYWREKWENGLWIMINGEPTWLSGMHIDHLIFNKQKNERFYYLDSQKERFYFRELTNRNIKCDGRLWAKGRRVGITSEEITEAIRVLLSGFGNHVGCQSDTFPKAKSTLLTKIIETYLKRPKWMREEHYSVNGKVPRSSLELTDSKERDDDNYPLGGTVRAFPTTAKALDGEEFMLVINDELSKPEDVDPYEMFEVNKKTIVNPGKRGKLDALSTTGDSKESQKAVRSWHKLIADSNPDVINANGQTNSGLWRYVVTYCHSLELLERHPELKDKYGKIDIGRAEEIIWNEVKRHPKDSKEYVYALYKMPMRLEHTLLTTTGSGYFSKLRISNRLDILRNLPNDQKPYVIGSLEYDKNGRVYFESNEERAARCEQEGTEYKPGYWKIHLMPYFSLDNNIDTRNRLRRINGVWFPPTNPEFGIGYDPIRAKKEDTTSNSLSDASIIVYKKHDYFGSGYSNRFAALWLHRPDDPRDGHRECIKGCKFFGCQANHERVIESVKEEFETANCLPLLWQNPKDKMYGMWIDGGGKVVKNAVDMMTTHFAPPKTPEDIDQFAEMPFEDVLVDMDGIDLARTTTFNVFMSMVQLFHLLSTLEFTVKTDSSEMNMFNKILQVIPQRQH